MDSDVLYANEDSPIYENRHRKVELNIFPKEESGNLGIIYVESHPPFSRTDIRTMRLPKSLFSLLLQICPQKIISAVGADERGGDGR